MTCPLHNSGLKNSTVQNGAIGDVLFEESNFGFYIDKTTGRSIPIRKFTWKNLSNVTVDVINYGATIVSVRVPDKHGFFADIVTGFDDIEGYLKAENPYFGATVGRVANRIGYGQVHIGDVTYEVTKNLGKHQLHGGLKGFDKVIWEHYIKGNQLILSYHSADGEEGYPGDLVVHAIFELTATNEFLVEYRATTTKPTYVNMTNHAYFNLAGKHGGAVELYKHVMNINADKITGFDADSIPTGVLNTVSDTVYDFRVPKVLGDVIKRVPDRDGFDHNYCITKGPEQGNTFVARVLHPDSGRVLEIYSDQPGVQFYTSNFFPEDPKLYKGDPTKLTKLNGKGGDYYKHGAFALETQNWPDAPNHSHFPKSILYPGETYGHHVTYKFSIKA